jgi:hypothetical protein
VTVALDVALFVAGLAILTVTLNSAVRYTMLPRGVPAPLARRVALATRVIFTLRAGRSPSYERRDRIMAMYSPVILLALLTTWLVLLIGAFTAMYLGVGVRPVRAAFELSGSAIVTLGTASARGFAANALTYTEAALGLLLVTLLITYLPTIYSAFSRREAVVTLLEVRAGSPPSAVEMLIRFHRIGQTDRLAGLWRRWEQWFVEVEETHTSFPTLAYFRSPQPDHSWVVAAGTVLDAASLWAGVIEHPNDPDAQLCIRAGSLALRRIGAYFNLPFNANPQPIDPITISRYEFDEACRSMADAGVPLRADREAAWEAYAGWRVNYDTILLNLARMTEAPLAPWVSDRSPLLADQVWTLRAAVRLASPTTRGRRSRRRASRG